MKIKFSIPAKEIAAMLQLCHDETRHAICGIRFELSPHQMVLIASDGRAMGLLKSETDPGVASDYVFTLPAYALRKLFDVDGEYFYGEVEVNVDTDACLAVLGYDRIEISCALMAGGYPEVRNAFPAELATAKTSCLNPYLFGKFGRMSEILTDQPYPILTHSKDSAGCPQFIITLDGFANFYGVQMGCAFNNEESEVVPLLPDWLKHNTTQPEK